MSVYYIVYAISLLFAAMSTHAFSAIRNTTTLEINRYSNANGRAANHFLAVFAIVLSAVPLVLISGLRSQNVGLDTYDYANEYKLIANDNFGLGYHTSWLSPGYVILCKVVSSFAGTNPFPMIFVVALFTFLFLFLSIYENSSDFFISIYLYICFALFLQTMNQSRQMLAISITTYSYTYVKKRNLKMFLLFILIATSIHASALVFLPVYFISKIRFSKKMIAFYITAIAGLVIAYPLIILLAQHTPYALYIGSWYDVEQKSTTILNLVFRILLLIVCLLFYKNLIRKGQQNEILYHISFACVALQTLTVKSYIFGRVTTYFFIFFIFLIPEVIYSIRNKGARITVYVIILILFAVYYFLRVTPENMLSEKFIPYYTSLG